MKKKIALYFVLGALLLLCMTACEKDGEKSSSGTENGTTAAVSGKPEENKPSDDDKSGENGADDEQQPTDDSPVFWFNQQEWTEPNGSFEGGLFHEAIGLPIDLRELDDIAAPYRMFAGGIYQLFDYIDTDKIGELLESEEEVLPGKEAVIAVLTDSDLSEEEEKELFERQKEYGIDTIEICNFSEHRLSIKSCYENGWWRVKAYDVNALRTEAPESDDEYPKALLDSVVQKFGSPTYLFCTQTEDDFYNDIQGNESMAAYTLVYEYPEYALLIGMQEYILKESDGKTYNHHSAEITEVYYYSAKCWEAMKETTADHYLFETRK